MTEHHFPLFDNHALCSEVDPEVWFPENGGNAKYKTLEAEQARQLCRACPALVQCREYALKYTGLFGIWGALDPSQRRDIQKKLNITPIHVLNTTPAMHEGFTDGVPLDTGRL